MSPPFVHRRRILFGDCDPGGIVYTPRISHFLIEANLAFLQSRGCSERRMFDLGVAPPARAMSLEFLKPMTWDDELEVYVSVKEIRTHAIALAFDGRVRGETTFRGELTMVCISKETVRPVPVPAELREAILGGG